MQVIKASGLSASKLSYDVLFVATTANIDDGYVTGNEIAAGANTFVSTVPHCILFIHQ